MGGLVGKSDWGAAGRPRKGSAGVEGGIPNVKLAVLPRSVVSLGSFSRVFDPLPSPKPGPGSALSHLLPLSPTQPAGLGFTTGGTVTPAGQGPGHSPPC